ncbi:MAG: hypothetical protein ABFS39_13200 [Pseudomonadota bacterium]
MNSQFRFLVTALSAGIIGFVLSTTLYAMPPHKVQRHLDHRRPVVIHHGPAHPLRPDRIRRHRNVIIVRPYGHWYPGFGWFRADDNAIKWLSFTAITLRILDNLNE